MKPCYFCHLAVSWPWVKITFNVPASIKGGNATVDELAHPLCCARAQRLIEEYERVMAAPFPSKP